MKAKCGLSNTKNERRKTIGRGTRLFSASPLAFVFYGGKWTSVGIVLALVLVVALAYLSQRKPKQVKKSDRIFLSAEEPTYRVVKQKTEIERQPAEELAEVADRLSAEEEKAESGLQPAEEAAAPVMKKVTAAEAHRLLSDEAATEMMERATTEEKAAREIEQTTAAVAAEEVAATEAPKEIYRAVCAADSVAPVGKKHIVNVDTLSKTFASGDVVDLEALKSKGLLPKNAKAVKVLARGSLDKVLTVRAEDFSADAVKMIVLTGGKAIRV